MQPLISVIVPIYNAERYLKHCIESLITQTEPNIEIILINDGSTDKSLVIANEYAKKDSRITVINQVNSGPSDARNKGIDLSQGKYLSFIDADDWVEIGMYKEMLNQVHDQKVDIIYSNKRIVFKNTSIEHSPLKILKRTIFKRNEIIKHIVPLALEFGHINTMASNLYCNDMISKNKIRLNKDIKYGEDWIFNLECLKHSHSIFYVDDSFYNYRRDIESSSSIYNDKTFETNGKLIFKTSQEYAEHFNNDIYIGGANFLKVTIHCIINEYKRKDIKFTDKINRIMTMLNDPSFKEAIKYANLKKLSYKNKIFAFLINLRLNWLVCGYFGIKNIDKIFL